MLLNFIVRYHPRVDNLIQKRMLELMQGSRALIENAEGKTLMEIAVEEIVQDKIAINHDSAEPGKAL